MRFAAILLAVLLAASGCTGPDAGEIVDETIAAVTRATPQAPPSRKHGALSTAAAYRIQDLYAQEMQRRLGGITGYKVAFAGKAAQSAWGVSEPVTGPLFEGQRVENGGTVRIADFVQLNIEAELAFALGKLIDRPIKDVAELKKHVKSVHLALDIADNRFSARPTAADVIATGAGAHRYVVGPGNDPAKLDLDGLTIRLTKDGKAVYQGPSKDVLDGQWNCLLWQVNHLIGRGRKLKAGQVLLTGAVDAPYVAKGPAAAGAYAADAGPLGGIKCTVR